jgi:O-antigen/teichoic acid export membrane protein
MNVRASPEFIQHLVLVFGSQMLVLVSGLIKALIVPLFLGVEDFGYWQIYIFYVAYIGIFSIGYNDGIYLKYGGYRLENLPIDRIRSSNAIYLALLVIATIVTLIITMQVSTPYRQLVFLAVAANIVVLGIINNVLTSLQSVNRLRGFAFLNSADKIFFTLSLLALFTRELQTFWFLILVDLFAKVLVLALLLFQYREFYLGSFTSVADALNEFTENVHSGVQLMLANFTGMLTLGAGRIILEYFGTLKSYAFYALATSLANVILICVSALSYVIYPNLKQQDRSAYLAYFNRTNAGYSIFAILMLTGYYPAAAFILIMATSYVPVLDFLNVVFVIIILQGKMQLLNNTFYAALRLEGRMLVVNVASFLIAVTLSSIVYLLSQSLLMVSYATLLTMLFRVYASEYFLRRQMGGKFNFMNVLEITALAGFLILTTFTLPSIGFPLWSLALAVVAMIYHRHIASGWQRFLDRCK